MKYAPYSYSRIQVFYQCKKKFKYTYIDKIRIIEDSLALKRGSLLHYLIEHYAEGLREVPDFGLTLDQKRQCIESFKYFLKGYFDLEFITKQLDFDRFLKENLDEVPKHEIAFGITDDTELCSYYSKTAILRGKIDFLLKKDDKLFILDWKSGKYRTLEEQGIGQMQVYALAGFLMYPEIDEIETAFVYIEQGKINRLIFRKEDFVEIKKAVLEKIEKIEVEEKFERNVNELCSFCPFKDICDKEVEKEISVEF